MLNESFSMGDSQIHRLDPRLKVVFATVYSFVVALSEAFPALAAALVISCLLTGLARLNFMEVIRRAAIANALILLLWIVVPLTFEGKPMFHMGPVPVIREGVVLSARITLKCNAILLAFMALVASTPVATLGYALNRLRVPGKIIHLLLLTYRYVFVIDQEYKRLVRAARIRGFRPGTNMHTYRTYAYMIGMLFVRASARADRVHEAMVCRGFRGKFYCLGEFSFSRLDVLWSALMAITITGLGFMEYAW
jgi:cobalt/nickel transport system permease protein